MRQNRAAAFKQRKEQIVKLQAEIADLSRKVTIKPHASAVQGGKSSFYLQQLLNVTTERPVPTHVGVNQSFFIPSPSKFNEDPPRRGRSRSNPKLIKTASYDPTANILSDLEGPSIQKQRSVHSPRTASSISGGVINGFGHSDSGGGHQSSQGVSPSQLKTNPNGPVVKPFALEPTSGSNGSMAFLQPISATATPVIGDYSGVGSERPERKEQPQGPPKPKQQQPQEEDSMMGKLGKWFSNTFS